MYVYSAPITNEADTQQLASQLASQLTSGLVLLEGDLGAGKTTLVRFWLQALGVLGAIKSPTYTLVETYSHTAGKQNNAVPIYHFDLYRLNDPDELDALGFDDYIAQDDALILVEWAVRASGRLPKERASICIATEHDARVAHIRSNTKLNLAL